MDRDPRLVHRLVVDVLLEPHQLDGLQRVLEEALCDAPSLHDGPCRVAWSMSHTVERPEDPSEDPDDAAFELDRNEVAFVREHLAPIPVWPRAIVDRSLGA